MKCCSGGNRKQPSTANVNVTCKVHCDEEGKWWEKTMNRVALLAVQCKTLRFMDGASFYLCKYSYAFFAQKHKDGAKLYFCTVFALFVFFVGIHIFYAKTKDR